MYTPRYRKYCVVLLLTSLINTQAEASSCPALINRINADINKYNKTINTQHLSWMDFAWLRKHLGEPVTTQLSDHILQFSWTCQDDTQSSLVIQTDAHRKFILVKGEYNSSEGAGLFSADLSTFEPKQRMEYNATPTSYSQTKPQISVEKSNTSLEPQQQAYFSEGEKITKQDFKKWFKVDVLDQKNKNINIPLNLTSAYYTKLRQCIPGIYKYPVFNSSFGMLPHQGIFILNTASILGMQNGKCMVNITTENMVAGSASQRCQFSPKNLALFSRP